MTAPLPHRLRDDVVRAIAAQGVLKSFPARYVLIHEGDVSDTLFIIIEGRVKAYAGNEDGKEVSLGTRGPGEYVGELALDGGRRSASVVTTEPTRCAVVSGEMLRAFIIAHPDFALHLIHDLIGRVRSLTADVKSLALEDVYRRVASLLQRLAPPDPQTPTRVVREKLTHRDIAERVGSSREMVSRILKELKSGGYIETQGGLIALLKPLPNDW